MKVFRVLLIIGGIFAALWACNGTLLALQAEEEQKNQVTNHLMKQNEEQSETIGDQAESIGLLAQSITALTNTIKELAGAQTETIQNQNEMIRQQRDQNTLLTYVIIGLVAVLLIVVFSKRKPAQS